MAAVEAMAEILVSLAAAEEALVADPEVPKPVLAAVVAVVLFYLEIMVELLQLPVIVVAEVKPAVVVADGTVEIKAQTPMVAVAGAEESQQEVQAVDQLAVMVAVPEGPIIAQVVMVETLAAEVDMEQVVEHQVRKVTLPAEVTLFVSKAVKLNTKLLVMHFK